VSTIRKWVRNLKVTEKNKLLNKSELLSYSRHMDAVTGRATTNPVPPSKQPLVQPVKDWGFKTKKLKLVFEDGRACDWDVPIQFYDDFLRGAWMAVKTDNHSFSLQVKPPPVPSPTAPSPVVNPPEVGSIVRICLGEPSERDAIVNEGISVDGSAPRAGFSFSLSARQEWVTWRRVTR
jgi:hypothetical protein